jgi:peptide-methionine (S)-S-oxide reductase
MFVRFSTWRRTAAAVLLASVAAACSQAAPQAPARGATAQAVFAGGCFWCTEADFDKIPGVLATTSGYAGGKLRTPS